MILDEVTLLAGFERPHNDGLFGACNRGGPCHAGDEVSQGFSIRRQAGSESVEPEIVNERAPDGGTWGEFRGIDIRPVRLACHSH